MEQPRLQHKAILVACQLCPAEASSRAHMVRPCGCALITHKHTFRDARIYKYTCLSAQTYTEAQINSLDLTARQRPGYLISQHQRERQKLLHSFGILYSERSVVVFCNEVLKCSDKCFCKTATELTTKHAVKTNQRYRSFQQ